MLHMHLYLATHVGCCAPSLAALGLTGSRRDRTLLINYIDCR